MNVFCVIEDFHYESQTLIAVCASLELAQAAAANHHAVNVLCHEDADGPRPPLPEWKESPSGGTTSTYFVRTSREPGRVWVSKGDTRDYEIREMPVEGLDVEHCRDFLSEQGYHVS